MKLDVKDQIHVSSVQADTLRPGDQITVTKEKAEELLKAHPDKFTKVKGSEADEPEAKAEAEPIANKMEPAPENKAAPASKKKAK